MAKYLLWVWQERPRRPVELLINGSSLGCVVNPTPRRPGLSRQPIRCLRSTGIPEAGCSGVASRVGPTFAPWSRDRIFNRASVFTIQGIIKDLGVPRPTRSSLTNALVIQAF